MQRKTKPWSSTRRKCKTRKLRFDSEYDALKSIGHHGEDQIPGKQIPTRAYPCTECHGWHLTSREYRGDWTGVYQCCGGTVGSKHELSCESVSPEEFFARTGGRSVPRQQEGQ